MTDYYEGLIKDLNLGDQTKLFTSFIPNNEVKYYFSAADLIVQPYRTATQSGISQIAYHFEKPMIVTHVGGLPEIVADGKVGFVVPPEAPAITGSILRFYDENREPAFAANLGEEKKKYNWHYFTGNIMSNSLALKFCEDKKLPHIPVIRFIFCCLIKQNKACDFLINFDQIDFTRRALEIILEIKAFIEPIFR